MILIIILSYFCCIYWSVGRFLLYWRKCFLTSTHPSTTLGCRGWRDFALVGRQKSLYTELFGARIPYTQRQLELRSRCLSLVSEGTFKLHISDSRGETAARLLRWWPLAPFLKKLALWGGTWRKKIKLSDETWGSAQVCQDELGIIRLENGGKPKCVSAQPFCSWVKNTVSAPRGLSGPPRG